MHYRRRTASHYNGYGVFIWTCWIFVVAAVKEYIYNYQHAELWASGKAILLCPARYIVLPTRFGRRWVLKSQCLHLILIRTGPESNTFTSVIIITKTINPLKYKPPSTSTSPFNIPTYKYDWNEMPCILQVPRKQRLYSRNNSKFVRFSTILALSVYDSHVKLNITVIVRGVGVKYSRLGSLICNFSLKYLMNKE